MWQYHRSSVEAVLEGTVCGCGTDPGWGFAAVVAAVVVDVVVVAVMSAAAALMP